MSQCESITAQSEDVNFAIKDIPQLLPFCCVCTHPNSPIDRPVFLLWKVKIRRASDRRFAPLSFPSTFVVALRRLSAVQITFSSVRDRCNPWIFGLSSCPVVCRATLGMTAAVDGHVGVLRASTRPSMAINATKGRTGNCQFVVLTLISASDHPSEQDSGRPGSRGSKQSTQNATPYFDRF